MDSYFLVFIVIVIVIIIRVVAGSFDAGRIEAYLSDRKCTLLEKKWVPFGPGWFGEKDSRIYEVVYRDAQGHVHQAHVKTSWLSGVYLTNERVIKENPNPQPVEKIVSREPRPEVDEMTMLGKRLAELEGEWSQTSARLADIENEINAVNERLAYFKHDS